MALHAAAGVFVMPARSDQEDVEGFGLVFLEAGAAGRAVVGARAGGVIDAVRHGETGLLVPPSDPAALADAVSTLLSDEALRRRFGEAGRAHVLANATWDHVAERLGTELAARSGPRPRGRS
jgi:glycosyltransferase involved in cell wall biosynthesis